MEKRDSTLKAIETILCEAFRDGDTVRADVLRTPLLSALNLKPSPVSYQKLHKLLSLMGMRRVKVRGFWFYRNMHRWTPSKTRRRRGPE